MKIMMVPPCYWPSLDGVTRITKYLAEGLAQRGHEVFILTSAGDGGLHELPYEEEHNGVKIKRMRVYVRWPLQLKGRDNLSTPQRYYKEIDEYKPDVLVVICAQTWTMDWIIPYLGRINCVKVFYSHGYSAWLKQYRIKEELVNRNIVGAIQEWKKKRCYESFHKVVGKFERAIYLSEDNNSNKYAVKYNLHNGKVLENAIDDVFFEESMYHDKDSFYKDMIQFLYVANYNDNKNQKMLVEAFCEADIQNAVLQLVGYEENEYLRNMHEYVNEHLNVNSGKIVIFNYRKSREEIYDLYRNSNVFVSTSKSENSPIVHREAAATGMAVISTDVGDVSRMEGIILVEDGQELKNVLEKVVSDRTYVAEKAECIHNYVIQRKLSVDDKVEWLETEFEYLLNEYDNVM